MKIRNFIGTCLVILFIIPGVLTGAELDKNLQPGFKVIDPIAAYNYVKKLASLEFAGRLTGHEGYTAAAKWAAEHFKRWGLKPMDDKNGYLQPYPSPYTLIDKAEMSFFIDNKEVPLTVNEDFLPLLFSDNGDGRGTAVFAGWGIHAPDLGYDDYAGLDVKGKFVLCFRGTPDREDKRFLDHDHHRHRLETAQKKGALGLVYIYPEPVSMPNGDWLKGFTPVIISFKAADKLLAEKNFTAEALRSKLRETKKPHSFQLKSSIRLKVESRHFPDATGYNVVGILKGSDPQLKKECIVVGGHFDHNGLHMGLLFAGANDNASGSAVVMEIAHAFSVTPRPPKRSIIFVLFGGEEMGLMGSNYFAAHLPGSYEKVDTMFNYDMVGEGDGASVALTPEPAGLEEVVKRADVFVKAVRRTRYIRNVGVRSSDYAPFFHRGAACISIFSNGPHLAYHKTGDTIYRINPDVMADIARLAFLSIFEWGNR